MKRPKIYKEKSFDNKKLKKDNSDDSDNVKHDNETNESNKIEDIKNLVELLEQRNDKLEELKVQIANLATNIIGEPERNIKKFRDLLSLFDITSDDPEYKVVFLSLQKLVAFSALAIFKDILPIYKIKEKITEEEDEAVLKGRSFKLKKETKQLRDYERSLITLYKLYLNRLERMVHCINKGKSNKSNFYQSVHPKEAKVRIAKIGTKCLCELLISHPNFNHSDILIDAIVALMANNHHKEIADLCIATVMRVYKEDKLGQVSLEIVKSTAKLIKARNYSVNPDVLRSFLALKIKEVKVRDGQSKKDMKKIRSKLNTMSKREKKRNKKMQKLEHQLLETEAEESYERKLKFHTEILNQVFVTYFRILRHNIDNDKQDEKWFKALLSPVLEGLSKFAHLINFEFFDDLIGILHQFIEFGQLDDRQNLHSLQTIFTILSGEGNALNIDPQKAYSHLYVILLNINLFSSNEDIKSLLSCVSCMILKRKKQITLQRVLAFIKRLTNVAQQTTHHSSIAILNAVHHIIINHKQSDILLDVENCGVGSGVFLPEIEDPEYCNANATLNWELINLNHHYNHVVRKFSSHILNNMKANELPMDLVKKEPLELFEEIEMQNNFDLPLSDFKKNYFLKSKMQFNLLNRESSLANEGHEMLMQIKTTIS